MFSAAHADLVLEATVLVNRFAASECSLLCCTGLTIYQKLELVKRQGRSVLLSVQGPYFNDPQQHAAGSQPCFWLLQKQCSCTVYSSLRGPANVPVLVPTGLCNVDCCGGKQCIGCIGSCSANALLLIIASYRYKQDCGRLVTFVEGIEQVSNGRVFLACVQRCHCMGTLPQSPCHFKPQPWTVQAVCVPTLHHLCKLLAAVPPCQYCLRLAMLLFGLLCSHTSLCTALAAVPARL